MPTAVPVTIFRAASTDGKLVVWAKTLANAVALADGNAKVRSKAAADPNAVPRGGKPGLPSGSIGKASAPQYVLDILGEDDIGVICFTGIGN